MAKDRGERWDTRDEGAAIDDMCWGWGQVKRKPRPQMSARAHHVYTNWRPCKRPHTQRPPPLLQEGIGSIEPASARGPLHGVAQCGHPKGIPGVGLRLCREKGLNGLGLG